MSDNPTTIRDATDDGRWRVQTVLPDGKVVSTVLLYDKVDDTIPGICRKLDDLVLDPLLGLDSTKRYETIVFAPNSYDALTVMRWATEQEASEGHEKVVVEWMAKVVHQQ